MQSSNDTEATDEARDAAPIRQPEQDWQRTSPLAAVFFLGRIVQMLAKNALQSIAPLAAFVFTYQGSITTAIVIGVGAFVVISVSTAVLRYWFFRYVILDDSILIREGVFKKTQLDIKYDRIQAVNTEQNIIYRKLGLTTVRFDTAGSAGQEGSLPAVPVQLADDLQARISRRRMAAAGGPAGEPGTGEQAPAEEAEVLLSLSNADVFKSGLTSNRALIFLALLAPAIEPLTERLDASEEVFIDAATQSVSPWTVTAIIVGTFLGITLLLMTASVVGSFLRYHRFQLCADDTGFSSTGGLLTRHAQSIRFTKIQAVYLSQNIVHRLFGVFRFSAKQASSGQVVLKKSFVLPHTDLQQVHELGKRVFDDEFEDAEFDPASADFEPLAKHFIRSRTMLIGVLPAGLFSAAMSLAVGWAALAFLLWIPAVFLIVLRVYRRYGLITRKDGLALRSGFVGCRIVAALYRKVQRISITQSPFQRRRNLATMRLFLASGSVRIPYLEYAKAQALADYILYQVEASNRTWH